MKKKVYTMAVVAILCVLSMCVSGFADDIEDRAAMVAANQGSHQAQGDAGGVFTAMLNSTQGVYAAAGISGMDLVMLGRAGGGPASAEETAQLLASLPAWLRVHASWFAFKYDVVVDEGLESLLTDYQVVYVLDERQNNWYIRTADTNENVSTLVDWLVANNVRTDRECEHGPDDGCLYN